MFRDPESDTFNHLCGLCRRIFDTVQDVGCHEGLVYHETLESLIDSAKRACGICTTLLDELNFRKAQHSHLSSFDRVFPIKCECDTSGASWQSAFDMTFALASFGLLKFTFEAIQDPSELHCPTHSTDSPQAWQLIRKWLQQCTNNHHRCNALPPEPWAPSRLLDISTYEEGFVRLAERDESSFSEQPYATLSHCWGLSQPIQTCRANIAQHHTQIQLSEMPKTFQDAIRVAAILELQYLWVDSLCIVQDSLEDWNHEAGEMSKVYRNGFINIAATGAAHGAEGCFCERDPVNVRPTHFSVRWSNTSGEEVKRYQVVPEAYLWARRFVSEPLLQRGWVFQERILSPRMLHFGQEQLFWECRESVACETYPGGLPASLRDNTLVDIKTLDLGDEPKDSRWPAKYVSAGFNSSDSMMNRMWTAMTNVFKPVSLHQVTLNTPVNRPSIFRDWDAAVEMYSLGDLTYDRDKLVALSGLADAISIGNGEALQDGYLAGLWQSSLPSHLLWTTQARIRNRSGVNETLIPHRIKTTYIAPSWSWASINGKISFKWCQYNYDAKDYLAELQSAELKWSTRKSIFGRFGEVESGSLQLSAPLASALRDRERSPDGNMSVPITHIYPSSMHPKNAIAVGAKWPDTSVIYFDQQELEAPEVLTLLLVVGSSKRTAHETETVLGLVLRKMERADEYVRLGIFHVTQERACRILKNMPRQTVKIV